MTCVIIHDWQPRECDCVHSASCLFSFYTYTAGRRKQPRKHGHLRMSRLLRGYVATSVCQQSSMHLPANHAYKMEIQHFVLAGAAIECGWPAYVITSFWCMWISFDRMNVQSGAVVARCKVSMTDLFNPSLVSAIISKKTLPATPWDRLTSSCFSVQNLAYKNIPTVPFTMFLNRSTCSNETVLSRCLFDTVCNTCYQVYPYPSTCASLGACPWRQEAQPAAPHFEGTSSLSLVFFFH